MSEATVVLRELKPAEGNRPYKLVDGNDTEYATFDEGIAKAAREVVGQKVTITFTEKTAEKNGRTYTNRYAEKVEPVKEAPTPGTGDYVTGQKPAIEVRRIAAAVAWNNAARLAPLIAGISAETVFKKTKQLSDAIFLDLLAKGKALEDDDIPF